MSDMNGNNEKNMGTGNNPSGDNVMALLSHVLGSIFCFIGFIGPLVIFFIAEDKPFVKEHAKESLNFQLTLLIGYIVGFVLTCILVGYVILLAIWVVSIIFGIQGAMAANKGEGYVYPFAIRLIK